MKEYRRAQFLAVGDVIQEVQPSAYRAEGRIFTVTKIFPLFVEAENDESRIHLGKKG